MLRVLSIAMETSANGCGCCHAARAGIGRVIARTFVEPGARVHVCMWIKALKQSNSRTPSRRAKLADVDRLFSTRAQGSAASRAGEQRGIAGRPPGRDIRPEDWDCCHAPGPDHRHFALRCNRTLPFRRPRCTVPPPGGCPRPWRSSAIRPLFTSTSAAELASTSLNSRSTSASFATSRRCTDVALLESFFIHINNMDRGAMVHKGAAMTRPMPAPPA